MGLISYLLTAIICGAFGFVSGMKFKKDVNITILVIFCIITIVAFSINITLINIFGFKIAVDKIIGFYSLFYTFALYLKYRKTHTR